MPNAISEKLGVKRMTVYQWQNRDGWKTLQDKVKQQIVKSEKQDLNLELARQSLELRKKLASDLESAASRLPKHSSQLNKFSKRQEGIGKLISNASNVFGWHSVPQSESRINIAVLTVNPDQGKIPKLVTNDTKESLIDLDPNQPEPDPSPPQGGDDLERDTPSEKF